MSAMSRAMSAAISIRTGIWSSLDDPLQHLPYTLHGRGAIGYPRKREARDAVRLQGRPVQVRRMPGLAGRRIACRLQAAPAAGTWLASEQGQKKAAAGSPGRGVTLQGITWPAGASLPGSSTGIGGQSTAASRREAR